MEPIKIRGLKQNNLKNVSLDIPKNKIVVFTGVSGSGKSSIVFDTIAAESQRQMNETYSAWIRGAITTELIFMEPVTTMCECCNGTRYSEDACSFFDGKRKIMDKRL